MGLIRMTYDIVTPESAEDGDFAESGWTDEEGAEYTVEEAIDLLRGREPSSTSFHRGVWYSDADGDIDYHTGAETRQSYHLDEKTWTEVEERTIYASATAKMIGIFRD